MVLGLVLLHHLVYYLDSIVERLPGLVVLTVSLTIHSYHSIVSADEAYAQCPRAEDIADLVRRT